MIKRTVVTQRTVVEGVGHVMVQFEKQAVDTDGTIYVPKNHPYHRTVFEVGYDVDAWMLEVNKSLEKIGLEPVSAEEIAKIRRTCDAEWTPECRAAWAAQKEKQTLAMIFTMPASNPSGGNPSGEGN